MRALWRWGRPQRGPQPTPAPRPPPTSVPFRALFRFADATDRALYAGACVSAACNGAIFPLFALTIGGVFNSLGGAASLSAVVDRLQRYALYFLLLGIGALLFTFGEHALAAASSERQVRRMREAYFAALLRQPLAWHDTGAPGEAAAHLAEDTLLIQAGMGERATEVLHFLVTALVGVAIGLARDAALAGVVLAFVPLIVASGALLRVCTLRLERRSQDAYARAGDAANEALGAVRTVAACGAEAAEAARYAAHLDAARAAGVSKGWWVGAGVGLFYVSLFAAYAVSLRYGAARVVQSRRDDPACRVDPTRDGCFTGGSVI